ncbi:MAG: outer membrane beta-barrel protein [Verrucomicrobia bacterium]|nr:outer membrane beta-barrel protein [Verrucomicrobiota bacterium]
MKNKRRLALLAGISAAPAFAAPFLAIGENAELFVTAGTNARFEDNITLSSSAEQSDEIFEFSPGAELVFGKGSLTSGSLTVFERFIAYSDHTTYNDNLANVLFKSSYEGAKLALQSNASYVESSQATRDVQSIIASSELAAGLNGELTLTEKSKIGAGIQFSDVNYDPVALPDRSIYTIPVNYFFAVRPKLDLSTGIQYRHTDVDATDSDSDDYYFNVGARGEFTPKLVGNFSVGYNLRETDAAAPADDSQGSYGLKSGLTYLYSPKTQFSLDLSNDFATGSAGGGQEVMAATVGASSSVAADLTLRASISYSKIDYLNSAPSRTDDYIVFNTGATYTINEHASLTAAYTFLDNASDISTSEFSGNVLSISANFRY